MDLTEIYSKIDNYFSQYISDDENDKPAIKSKILVSVCDFIKSNYEYQKLFDNGDVDYLPVVTATSNALKYYKPNTDDTNFHSYLLKCIKNAIYKDVSINVKSNLNYDNIKALKKIKKLLPMYHNNKQVVADVMDISINKLNALLNSENVLSLDAPAGNEESEQTAGDFIAANTDSAEAVTNIKESLKEELSEIDTAWKEEKSIHQPIISDWFTSKLITSLDDAKLISKLGTTDEVIAFLSEFSFINISIVKNYLNDRTYILPAKVESIAENHNVTKSAVSKKINNFLEKLKK